MNNHGLTPEKVRAWVEKHFPDFKERRDGNELVINNPFDGDTGYNFNIGLGGFGCHDWRGDYWQGTDNDGKPYKRTFLQFVRVYLGCTWSEALCSVLGESSRYYPRFSEPEPPAPEQRDIQLPDGSLPLWNSGMPQQAGLLTRWLASRGVFPEDVRRNKLHHLGSEVIWPYHEWEAVVYWQSRSRLDKRFRFPPSTTGAGKADFLYGFDDVEPASYLVVTEAIFDKHALRDQAVASGGAVLSRRQLDKVRALGPREGVILAPDNDRAGRQSVSTNGRLLLERGWKVYYSLPPALPYELDGERKVTKDWNELGQFVAGWREVPRLLERGIRRLSTATLVRLQLGTPAG